MLRIYLRYNCLINTDISTLFSRLHVDMRSILLPSSRWFRIYDFYYLVNLVLNLVFHFMWICGYYALREQSQIIIAKITGRARDAVTANTSSPGKITRHFGIATNPTKNRRIPKKKIDV